MRIVAYCDARYEQVTRQAVGKDAVVLISPPLVDASVLLHRSEFERAGLVYFNFHADPFGDMWLNTDAGVALSADTVKQMNLSRVTVFMVNCYAGGAMLEALRFAGAWAIVGGRGENLGGVKLLGGADVLGLWCRRGMQIGLGARPALALAKARLRLMPQTKSVKDARAFDIL